MKRTNVLPKVASVAGLVFLTIAVLTATPLWAQNPETFAPVGDLSQGRAGHTATRLAEGKILIVGGEDQNGPVASSEVFDPNSATFSLSGILITPRSDHSATLLPDGRVLVIGGRDQSGLLASSEIFDPATNSFSSGPSLNIARAGHSATVLADGRILFAGGDGGSAEIYDPVAQSFSLLSANMTSPRALHGAVLLQDGKILIAGGVAPDNTVLSTAEIFDPQTMSFRATVEPMQTARIFPTLRVLPDGKVQVIGGDTQFSMEVFDVAAENFNGLASLPPTEELLPATLSTQSRAALITTAIAQNSYCVTCTTGDFLGLLDRTDHSLTEIPQFNQALVVGGVDSGGNTLTSAYVLKSSTASVTTQKVDYPPGATVAIIGTGFQPNETVSMILHEMPNAYPDFILTSVADTNGSFTNTDFSPGPTDLGRTFLLTAIGQSSGFTAQTTFTDARTINGVTLNGGASVTVAPNSSISAAVNVTTTTPGGNNWKATAWRIATTPPGTVTCVDHGDHTANGTFTETFNITAPSTAGTYNAYFIAYPNDNCTGTASNTFTMTNAVTVDTTPPGVSSINRVSGTPTNAASVDFAVTFSENVTGVDTSDFALATTGVSSASITGVSGSGSSYTVTVNTGTGDGTIGLNLVDDDSIVDVAGNKLGGTGAGNGNFTGQVYTIDKTAPTVAISAPSVTLTKGGPVSYTVTYSNADAVTLANGNVTLNATGTAAGTVAVSGSGNAERTVTISSITGDGTLGISIAAGTASDTTGNLAAAAGPSATFTVDNTPPTLSISAPSATLTKGGPVSYTVTYSNADAVTLANGNVTLNATGTAAGTVAVSGSGNITRTVTISGISGDGTLGISIAASTASDTAGNLAAGAGPSATFTVDNTPPTVSISAPSATLTKGGPVSYTVTYGNADAVTLANGNVTLNATGTANGTVAVSGSGNTERTVMISSITGDGTLGISIAAGTASDEATNEAAAAGPSATFTVDNTPPTVSISAPSATLTKGGPVSYTVTYGNADAVTLANGNVTLNATGTANGTVAVSGSGNTERTVTISSITGDGTLGISIATSTASDLAGNLAPGAGPSDTFTVDNTPPTVSISAPSVVLTKGGPVSYTVTYGNADAVTLANGNVTLNATGTANGTVAVSGSGNTERTVMISSITGDGTLGISIAAGTASDTAGNLAAAAGPSATFTVDNTPPTVAITLVSDSLLNASEASGGVTVTWQANESGLFSVRIGGSDCTDGTEVTTGSYTAPTPVATAIGSGLVEGDNTIRVCVTDTVGNTGSDTTTVTEDTLAPPAPTVTGPADPSKFNTNVTLNFTDTESVTFTCDLDGLGFEDCGSGLSGSKNYPGELSDGLHTFTVKATDAAGNFSSTILTWTIDTAPPTVSISAPSATLTKGGPVSYTVTYSNADAVTLAAGDVTLNKTDTANGTVAVSGSGNTERTVTISSITGDGTLGISIAAGTASDEATNEAPAAGPSDTFTVDNTPPTLSISAPSATLTKGGPVSYTVTYSNADAVTLAAGDVTLNKTDTANGTVAVSGSGNTERTVTISSITGDGTLGISIAANTASDTAGNLAAAAGPSATFTVDNTPPTVSISAPSATLTKGGPVSYTVTYSKADTVTLAAGDVTLNKTGTANGTVAVSGSGNTERTVMISSITGDGTLGISIAAGTASDTAGNLAAAAGPSATFTVDNTPPTLSISAPSATLTKGGPVSYTVTYSNADTVTLAAGDVTLNKTDTANGTVAVSGSGNTERTVMISSITGDGTLGISIAASTASDQAGNLAAGAGPSATFTVDNTPPTVSISAPSVALTKGGPVTYTVTYSNADAVTLADIDVTLNATGTATGTVAVTGSGNTERTVMISSITGDGTLGISIAASTASDTAGNQAAGAGPSGTFTVDNTPPTVSISAPSATLTKGGPVTYTVTYSGADSVTLSVANVTLNTTGTAAGTVAVSGSGNITRTVTISGISGDGTLGISIAASTASDQAGNLAAGTGPSDTFTVDNTPPNTNITANPPNLSNSSSASFSFGSPEVGSTFECKLDSGNFALCSSPQAYSGLVDGSHTFQVRAIDKAGNTDATPASFTWTVDTTPPDTVIDTHPTSLTNDTSATFTFHSTEASSTFECSLDGETFATCLSPKNYSGLAAGIDHTFQVRATDPAGNTDPTPASFTWHINAAPSVFNNLATQNVQYSDPIAAVTITAADVDSSGSSLTASASGLPAGLSLNNSTSNGSTIPGSATWTVSGNVLAPPGTYNVTVTVTDGSGGSGSTTFTIIVTQEDALAEYSGPTYFATSSPTSYKATVTLSATIKDADDGASGNITNAKVEFRRDSSTGPLLGTANLPVGLVNPSDTTVGTATTTFTYTLAGSEISNMGASLAVYVVVNGYHIGLGGPAVVTISIPGSDNVSGGGFLVLQKSNGQYAGAPGSKNNFGFTMKYNKSGKNLQGQANIIVRNSGKIYQIKSNAINSLAVNDGSNPAQATFTTKANMKDITNPLTPIDLGGNLTLQVDMADGGQNDSIGITVWNSSGGLYFSSNWDGTKTAEQTLGGGNLVVH